MAPVLALGLVGAAAAAAYLFSKRNAVRGQVPGALPGVVDTLTKGKSYAVMVTLTAQDGRNGQPAIGTVNPAVASANIKNIYEVLGFKMLSAPAPRNTGELSDFLHKNPSIWLFNAQWTGETGPIGVEPKFILSHTFVELPVQ